jgi:hypothetical protein
MWGVIVGLTEERDLKLLKERRGHLREKCFQVSASPSEPKPAKVRKCDASRDRLVQQFPLHFMVGNRGMNADPKYLEVRQK